MTTLILSSVHYLLFRYVYASERERRKKSDYVNEYLTGRSLVNLGVIAYLPLTKWVHFSFSFLFSSFHFSCPLYLTPRFFQSSPEPLPRLRPNETRSAARTEYTRLNMPEPCLVHPVHVLVQQGIVIREGALDAVLCQEAGRL